MGLPGRCHGATAMIPWGYQTATMGLSDCYHGATGLMQWGYQADTIGLPGYYIGQFQNDSHTGTHLVKIKRP